ncbi:FAD/NAD(P)-binding domain-containing protein [Teratosphaeria destructans]|uniref:FAD/NAD(P)-binding domain-containing protein n=1 Tax=Teratosphaeria destructans TaxID=418781 RepID=A0A9W7SKE8_9PEZI|nr:FAD/NAD(P)-binding domain-containing protein [Teratosphaeria destructans]
MFGDWTWAVTRDDLFETLPFVLTAAIMYAILYPSLFPSERGWRLDGSPLPSKRTFMAALAVPSEEPAQDEECPICQGQLEDAVQPECKHTYCKACLSSWFDSDKNWCPQCHRTLFVKPTDPRSIPCRVNVVTTALTVMSIAIAVALDLYQRRRLWWANLLMLGPSIAHMGLVRLAVHVKGPDDWWQMVSTGTYMSDIGLCLSHAWGLVTLLMEVDKAWTGAPRPREQMWANMVGLYAKWWNRIW